MTFTAILKQKKEETQTITTFTFTLDADPHYTPGQFIIISHETEKRAFSILDYNNKELKLGIKCKGTFTHELFAAPLGTTYTITGPFGRFAAMTDHSILIAGGIGIIPLLNIAKHRTTAQETILFYSSNDEPIPYVQEIQKLPLTFYLRNTNKETRLSVAEIIEKIPNYQEKEFLVCGPPAMNDSIIQELKAQGVKQILTEGFTYH
jgi:ferredoxin-NADP reductase